jgi:WD40 repeat protein
MIYDDHLPSLSRRALLQLSLGATFCKIARSEDDEPAEAEPEQAVELRTLKGGHTDLALSVSLSPNNRKLISGGDTRDHKAVVWDFTTGRQSRDLDVQGAARQVVFMPDNRRALIASDDKTIYVWDTQNGNVIGRLRGHTGLVFGVAVTRNGKFAASVSADGTARIWDPTGGLLLQTISISEHEVRCVAFTPNAATMLTGDNDSLARLWNLQTGLELVRYVGHTKSIFMVAFSPDGKRFVSGSDDQTARIWDVRTGRQLANLDGVSGPPYGVAWSPDGRLIAGGLGNQRLLIWEASTGKLLHGFDIKEGGILGVTFTSDSRKIIGGCGDGSIWVGGLPARFPDETPRRAPAATKKARTKGSR